jgi:hypothetical protein
MRTSRSKLHATNSKRVICIASVTCALFGLPVANRMSSSRTAAAEWSTLEESSTNTFAQQPPGEDPPVEKTHKNIQVLQGLPERQLFPLMNFVATSLGVHCDYCHVKKPGKNERGDDNWVWESDDKPKKLVGRRMIKMVMDINRTNFNSTTPVTCFTCHRGNTVIANLPPLPPHRPVRTEVALPSAEQIMAKYLVALGGKDAAAKLKTTVMKGTIEFENRSEAEGRNVQIEITLKGPDKYLITWTKPQGFLGITAASINGNIGWARTSAGLRKLSERELEAARRPVALYRVIKVTEPPAQMKVLGTETIGGREAYVVARVVNADTTRKFFFDTQTGLLLRMLTTTQTLLAPLPEQVEFEDYREVDGVKVPFTIRISDTAPFTTGTRRFTDIRHNVSVSEDIFNLSAVPR